MEFYSPTFIISIIASVSLAIWNLFLQINLSNLKEKSQKQIHVHKLQFEKEFKIYEEVWLNLIQLRNVSHGLRTEVFFTAEGETYEDAINEKIKEVSRLRNEFVFLIEKNEPFYSEEVYNQLLIFNHLVRKEMMQTIRGSQNNETYWEDRNLFYEKISKPIENIQIAIRKRISNLNTDNS